MSQAPAPINRLAPGGLSHWLPDTRIPLHYVSIGALLEHRASTQGDRTAVMWEADGALQRLSYADLFERARRLAGWLLEQMEPGDCVATWTANVPEFVLLEYACALSGIVLAPFNAAWTEAESTHAVGLIEPRILFVGNDNRGHSLVHKAGALPKGTRTLPIDRLGDLAPDSQIKLPAVGPDAAFLIQFTSGTTGLAKGAALTQSAMLNSAWIRPFVEGADADDVWLNSVPYHHVGGSGMVILGALSVGGACVVMRAHDADTILRLIEPTGATRLGGVPTMFHDIIERPEGDRPLRVKVVTLGGAMVSADLVRQVSARLGAAVTISYAQSECPIITATHPSDPPELVASTVGRPAPHVEMKIVDPKTNETLAVGDVGEVCVKAPFVMTHYFDAQGDGRAAFDQDGFLHTGDLGSLDDDGYCRLRGRARELIIRGGENVYPAEVELALARHPAVADVAVVGVKHRRLGQEIAAAIRLRDGMSTTHDELAAFASTQVAHFKVPRHWAFVDSFSMTASGKIRKLGLERLFPLHDSVDA